MCPHCAEELPAQATVCSNCHKDPAVLPAWAVPNRPDEAPPWSSPNRVPDPLDDVPGPYKGLEPEAARVRPIPLVVWVSFGLALFSGAVGFGLPGTTGLLLDVVGRVTGLILGIVGRHRINNSNGRLGGLMLANIAIALNLIWLVQVLFASGPVLQSLLAR